MDFSVVFSHILLLIFSYLSICFPLLAIMAGAQDAQQSRGKQADYIREISDLQETLEWKDKKIRVQLLFMAMFH